MKPNNKFFWVEMYMPCYARWVRVAGTVGKLSYCNGFIDAIDYTQHINRVRVVEADDMAGTNKRVIRNGGGHLG